MRSLTCFRAAKWSTLVLLGSPMLLLPAACTDSTAPLPSVRTPPSPRRDFDYLAMGNPCDNECDLTGGQAMAYETSDAAPSGTPRFLGTFDTSGPFVCPPFINNAPISATVVVDGTTQTALFNISLLVGATELPNPPQTNGQMCSYTLDHYYNSTDGRFQLEQGGKIIILSQVEIKSSKNGRIIYGGNIYFVKYEGNVYGGSGSPGSYGPSDEGWAYEDTVTGFTNGDGSGWQNALIQYESYGACTVGWGIIVDGEAVC